MHEPQRRKTHLLPGGKYALLCNFFKKKKKKKKRPLGFLIGCHEPSREKKKKKSSEKEMERIDLFKVVQYST